MQNERSLTRKGQWNWFNTGVKEYSDMGHSERVPEQDLKRAEAETFYLPMHGVVKESSTTTKLRIVFDASAKSTTGNSLNDLLLPGPNFYPLLTTVLLRFRQHDIGMSSDISKMFREFGLHPKERDLHRYVTRGDGSSKLEDWRMTRLTFGVTSSPFLATQVLHQVASDYQTEFPQAAEIVKNTFYVDDCLTGASTVEEAITLREELNCLLEKACMRLRKWRSNSNDLLESIPEEMRETENIQVISAPEQCHKALGVHWHTIQDTLHVATPTLVKEDKPTKRQIASDIVRTFDILGWYAPAVIKLKILLQQLWQLQLDWDQPVSEDIAREWKSWRDDLHILTDHAIPRCYYKRGEKRMTLQLHGFCDASQVAYAGVVYLRAVYEDTFTSISLVFSKTRVAPLTTATIPCLELCGVQLLSKLLQTVRDSLNIPLHDVFAWCDSSITLSWIHTTPSKLKTFVANRVADTTARVPASHWRYVPTAQNPADIASRGADPKELLESTQWWDGPPWLSLSPDNWPVRLDLVKQKEPPDHKPRVMLTRPPDEDFTLRFSSYNHMLRIAAWCRRFAANAKTSGTEKRMLEPMLQLQEIEEFKESKD